MRSDVKTRTRAEDDGMPAGQRAAKIRNKLPGINSTGAWRKILPIHPAAERIREATHEERRLLAGDLQKRGQQMKVQLVIIAGGHPQLLDGRTRLDLLEALGVKVIDDNGTVLVPHDIIDMTDDAEAEARSLSLNVHRRHLSAEDKRKLIETLLKANPEKSDRLIAAEAIVGLGGGVPVDHKKVASARRKLEATGEVPQLDKTVGADGKTRKRGKGWSRERFKRHRAHKRGAPMPVSARVDFDLGYLEQAWDSASAEARVAFIRKRWDELQYIAKNGSDDKRSAIERIADRAEARSEEAKKKQAADDLDFPECLRRTAPTTAGP